MYTAVLLHFFSEDTEFVKAKIAETAAIALLGKDNLANLVKGSRSAFTNASPREIIDHYNARDVILKHKVIMIIRNPWNPELLDFLPFLKKSSIL